MSNKNIEMMKKLIEEKKNRGAKGVAGLRAEKNMGKAQKGKSSKKNGGVFDK